MLAPWKKSYDKPRQHIKKERYHLADKCLYSQSYGFSSSYVQMWELDHKEGWVPKNECFQIVVLQKTLESPLRARRPNQSILKEINCWIFIGRTDAEALILWPPGAKSRIIGKDPNAGKDWGQEKEATENEMVGWHHWLNGHKFEQAPGDGEGQGSLVCGSPWGCEESDTTEQLNNKVLVKHHIWSWTVSGGNSALLSPVSAYTVTRGTDHLQSISPKMLV